MELYAFSWVKRGIIAGLSLRQIAYIAWYPLCHKSSSLEKYSKLTLTCQMNMLIPCIQQWEVQRPKDPTGCLKWHTICERYESEIYKLDRRPNLPISLDSRDEHVACWNSEHAQIQKYARYSIRYFRLIPSMSRPSILPMEPMKITSYMRWDRWVVEAWCLIEIT